MAGSEYLYVSADSHILEPRNLWMDRVDKRFLDKAPRVVRDPEPDRKGDFWVTAGVPTFPAAQKPQAVFGFGETEEYIRYKENAIVEDNLPGSSDPAARLTDMAQDGLEAEVIYPTYGLFMYRVTDVPTQYVLLRAYNDWIAEYVSHDPKHLAAVGVISLKDVDQGIAEMTRCAKMGLKAALIGNDTGEDVGYGDPKYDPFWAACVDANMLVAIHNFTGMFPSPPQNQHMRFTAADYPAKWILTDMIFTGIFDRFPDIRVVMAEFNVAWIPQFMYACDDQVNLARATPPPKLRPSEYFQRNVWASLIDDPVGGHLVDQIGVDRVVWSSDYPHFESSWPNSRQYVERNFSGLPADTIRKITRDNIIKLYDLPLETTPS